MSSIGQVETYDTSVRFHQRRVDGEIGRTAVQRLHVHALMVEIETEDLQCALLTRQLHLADGLVATVVSATHTHTKTFIRT